MSIGKNTSKTYTIGDVSDGMVAQGDYIINNSSVTIIPSLSNPTANEKTDVLLVTATEVESKAILDVFQKITGEDPHLVRVGDHI